MFGEGEDRLLGRAGRGHGCGGVGWKGMRMGENDQGRGAA